MLYVPPPKREQEVYQIDNFVRWLCKQPQFKRYDFHNSTTCASTLYLQENGVFSELDAEELIELGWHRIVSYGPQRFGAAAKRGAELLGWKLTWRDRIFGVRPKAS